MRLLTIQSYLPTVKGLAGNFLARGAVYPFYASFKLTSRCHFRCPFCNVKQERAEDLSTDRIKAILDNLSRSSILLTSFEGGEPLLRDDIGELLRYARTCKFYLLFTTSARNLLDYPLEEYAQNIDFFHVSIDEGHGNLEMFDMLPELVKLPSEISVQTVVTGDTVDALDEKVRRCYACGASIVVIPATHMDGTDNYFPDIDKLATKLSLLRKQFPNTIHTPRGYFNAYRKARCSSASIIIASDGYLYYPCHILNRRGPDLTTTDLTMWLKSDNAKEKRNEMKRCSRNCGWYQYYSITSYTSFFAVLDALRPLLVRKHRKG